MVKRKVRLLAYVLTAAVTSVAGLTGCNSQAGQGDDGAGGKSAGEICPTAGTTGTIKIAMSSPIQVFAPVTVGIASGAFKAAGLDVQITRIPLADAVPLVAQGQLDGQVTTWSAGHFNVVATGVDMKFIAPLERAQPTAPGTPMQGYWSRTEIVGSAENPDLSKLKGKTVASPSGGTGVGGKILSDALAKVGLGLGDVKLKTIAGADALAALENGAVDAAWIGSPTDVEAGKRPNLTQIATYAPGVTGASVIAGRSLLNRPEVLVRFFQVLQSVTQKYLSGDYRKNPESVAVIAKASQTPEDVIRQSALIRFDPKFSMDGVGDFLRSLQDFTLKQGGLDYKDPLPAGKLMDTRFSEALAVCRSIS
ncbi:ABC transporter substrate-binding protein [Actinomadura viridis]|uniref:ABC transporter substrate-binding protein n=1 Tax=Actinomadura viridis TaxID=58110 RepID=UPI0036B9158D